MSKINRILAVLDGSDDDAVIVAKAVSLAHQQAASLELFLCDAERAYSLSHAFDPSGVARSRRDGIQDAKRYLECLRDTAVGADVPIAVDAVCESPLYEGIVRKALRSQADLVIKSTGGRSSKHRTAWDANDWQLMRACPTTLVLSRGRSWKPHLKFALAVDVSRHETADLPQEILETSRLFSAGSHADIDVLYTEPPCTDPREHQKSANALQSLTSAAGLRGASIQILSGVAEEALPAFAAEQDYDVLIMGALSHREGPAALVGTLTSKLVETLECDFVLVKPTSYQSQIQTEVPESQDTELAGLAGTQINATTPLRFASPLEFVSPWQLPAR